MRERKKADSERLALLSENKKKRIYADLNKYE